MSAQGPYTPPGEDRGVGEMVLDISERLSILVREEFELAKAEVAEKVQKLLRGGAVGLAAGIFALAGFAMFMHGIAWLLDKLFFGGDIWIGFMVEAIIWFGLASAAGAFAYRSFKEGAPPVPEMAIEEAKLTRDAISGEHTGA